MPVPAAFLLLTTVFLIVAMLVIEVERTLLQNGQYAIAFRYSDLVEGFNGRKVWGDNATYTLSTQDGRLMQLYELLLWLLPPVTYLICLCMAGIIFYRRKLKIPLSLLSSSAAKIAEKDLDFKLHYDKNDEMGQLCVAFEKMRSALETNNREMWRQMEDRKRLNAAFSHDLRTPLTVLEGHLGILQKYTPDGKLTAEDLKEVYTSMAGQVERLKIYVSAMNDLQRLEDIEIKRQSVQTADFVMRLKDTAKMICSSKQLTFSNEITTERIYVCPEIVIQVVENLLSNAVRFARNSIYMKCDTTDNHFIINVADDGTGFSETVLKHATDPFYTTERKDSGGHFGLGLNICKILCERHNGTITLSNLPAGGAGITVSFGIDE